MEKNYYVYGLYKDKTDDLYYVGITKNIRVRMNGHRNKRHVNPIKQNYMKKYGCRVEIIWENLTLSEAEEREVFLIRWFGTIKEGTGILTNILTETNPISACQKGTKRTKKTKKQMSESAIKRNKNQKYLDKQRESHLTLHGITISKIQDIISEWERSDNGLPITKNKILKKHNIKTSRFNGWIQRYRPSLTNFINENKIKHVELWRNSGQSQAEYGRSIGVDGRTISLWKMKLCCKAW